MHHTTVNTTKVKQPTAYSHNRHKVGFHVVDMNDYSLHSSVQVYIINKSTFCPTLQKTEDKMFVITIKKIIYIYNIIHINRYPKLCSHIRL